MAWGRALDRPARARVSRPWREPLRVGLIGAGVLLLIGAPLPWLNASLPSHGDVSTNGFDLPGDGAITFTIGLALVVLGWFPSGTTSRIAPVVLAPLLLGVATVLLVVTGYNLNDQATIRVQNGGGEASDGIGLAITGVGGVVATLLGAVRIVRAGRSVRYRPDVSAGTVLRAVGGIVGSLGVVVAVIALAPEAGGQPNVGGITFLVMFGGLFGAYAGVGAVALAERFQRRMTGRTRT